ncbi:MAG: polyphosphate polymerase domain-containing protein [Alphaproteobacteria bacterium]|nr:polyphosphate polymerase domain-containing protein [Alphaproteobacteria bacterium]
MTGWDEGRYEFKYALPLSRRSELMDLTAPHTIPDRKARSIGADAHGYEVHSLYYDTFDGERPTLRDYFERLAERSIRDRLRVRTYGHRGEEQPVFLENKRKLDDRVVKARALIGNTEGWDAAPGPTPWRALAPGLRPKDRFAYRDFDRRVVGDGRRPVSVVHYVREVYTALDDPACRLTIDRDVCATTCPTSLDLYAAPDVDLIPRDWVVLEMKFRAHRPLWMRRICAALGLRAVPISKFGLSVALGFRGGHARELRFFTPYPLRRIGAFARRSFGARAGDWRADAAPRRAEACP